MKYPIRLLISLSVAFMLFPVMFVALSGPRYWYGPNGDSEILAGILMMFFIQFISPFRLWVIPLAGGLLVSVIWQLAKTGKAAPPAP